MVLFDMKIDLFLSNFFSRKLKKKKFQKIQNISVFLLSIRNRQKSPNRKKKIEKKLKKKKNSRKKKIQDF